MMERFTILLTLLARYEPSYDVLPHRRNNFCDRKWHSKVKAWFVAGHSSFEVVSRVGVEASPENELLPLRVRAYNFLQYRADV